MGDEKSGSQANIVPVQATTTASPLVKKNPKRTNLIIYNNGTDTVYLLTSGSGKTTDGMPILKGETYSNQYSKAAYWIIAASGTQDVRVEEDGD